jgi:hypothetical protein
MPLSGNEIRHNAIRFAKEARHYTSERDILKVIRSLFLDDLCAEFEKITGRELSAGPRPVPGRSGAEGTNKSADKPETHLADDALRAGTARGPLTGMRRRGGRRAKGAGHPRGVFGVR